MKYAIALIVVLALSFLWYAFSPLLFDVEVNDTLDPSLADKVNNGPTIRDTGAKASSSDSALTPPTEDGQVTVRGPFPLVDTPGHPATGEVIVIESEDETIVRYENYEGTNGPDLFVYLTKDLDAAEFVNLGEAKGNKGNINYTVPSNIDVNNYRYVVTWCKQFGVLFDYAEIAL